MPKRKQTEPASASDQRKTTPRNAIEPKNATELTWSEEVENFGKVYGWALYHGAETWIYHDDSGCWEELCEETSYTEGQWTVWFRPTEEMTNFEGGTFVLTFEHASGDLTDSLHEAIHPMIAYVNRLYLESYMDVRRVTRGKWSEPIVHGTVEEIARISTPLSRESNGYQMCMDIRGYEYERSTDGWTPRRLAKWLGYDHGDNFTYEHLMDHAGNYLPDVRMTKRGLPNDFYWFHYPSVDPVYTIRTSGTLSAS